VQWAIPPWSAPWISTIPAPNRNSADRCVADTDLRPFLGEKSADKTTARENSEPPRSLAEVYRSLSTATFDLKQLNRADADFTLGVGRWLSLPGEVRDVTLQVKLKDGMLQAPVKASIAGVALAGSADADSNASPPKFKLGLGTRDSDLAGSPNCCSVCAASTGIWAVSISSFPRRATRAANWCAVSMSARGRPRAIQLRQYRRRPSGRVRPRQNWQ